MIKKNNILYCLIALLALPALEVFAGPASFSVQLVSTFDHPDAVISTQPQKISDRGAVTGVLIDGSGLSHAFVRFPNGRFSPPLTDPNDTAGITQGRGINNSGTVCGTYTSDTSHGFFLQGLGFHDYDVPDSSFTVLLGLNNAGDFCGSDVPNSSGVQSGFVSLGRVITEFAIPDATNTLAYQINSSNQAVGYYVDLSGITHGYFRSSDGSIISPIDPAGSAGTIVFGNNDSNFIVGRYLDSSGITHGLVFIPPSTYVTYDFPGSTFTSLNGINARGSIVGRYLDSSGIEHGLLARLVPGSAGPSGGAIPQRQPAAAGPVKPLPGRSIMVEPAL